MPLEVSMASTVTAWGKHATELMILWISQHDVSHLACIKSAKI
jgi:hypothetical protein